MLTHRASPSPGITPSLSQHKLNLAIGLIAVIWLVGAVGHFTPLVEWPALVLYVLGALGLTLGYCARTDGWRATFITRRRLAAAMRWGFAVGGALLVLNLSNTYLAYRSGVQPMAQMESLLVGMGLVYLFPILVLAEEFFWRGLFFSALLEQGLNRHTVVAITTMIFVLTHFFVAPVGMVERGLLAMMALPLGLMNGYLVAHLRNLWGGVVIHALTMLAMIADILLLPLLL